MESIGLKVTSVIVRCLLGPMNIMAGTSSLNSPNRGFNPSLTAHPPPPPTPPRYTSYLRYYSGCEKFLKIQQ